MMPDWHKKTIKYYVIMTRIQWMYSDIPDICDLLIVARNHCKYINVRMAQIYD